MDESRLLQMQAILDNPSIGAGVKGPIREALKELGIGGFKAAYEKSLSFQARTDLNAFSEYVYGYKPAAHHKEITKILMDYSRKRELIVTGPNHSKSTYVSNIFPAFWLGHNPEGAAILVSRSAKQAEAFLGSISETISGNTRYKEVFPDTKPNKDRGWTKSGLFLANRERKSRPDPNILASGVVGPVIGRRAELIIVDDAQDRSDALSETISEGQREWIAQTLLTRLSIPRDDRFLAVMTRWHADDLASFFFNDLHFRLTLIPTIGDPDKGAYAEFLLPGGHYRESWDSKLDKVLEEAREDGHEAEIVKSSSLNQYCVRKYLHEDKNIVVWPSQHPHEDLMVMKEALGSVQFDLVYNGNATGLSGDVFKREWFRLWGPGEEKEFVPEGSYYFQSVDVAVSTKESADYFVIATVAVDLEGNIYVVDVFRQRIEAPQQPKLVAAKYREYPKTQWVLIESNAYQLALFQNVAAEGIPVRKYKAQKDKEARARSAAAKFEANMHDGAAKVYFNKYGSWLNVVKDELTSFPRGEHDDAVDALSSLFEELALNPMKPTTYRVTFG